MQPFETTDEIFKNVSVSFIWILQWLKITSHQRAFWFHFVSTYFIRAPIQPNAPSSLFLMSRISPLHSGHCSAMAHRASSSAPWVSGSGSERHWTSLLRIFLSQPSSRIRMVIHGCARTQLPKAWRLSLHSSAASSHLSSQVRLTFIGPGAELESKAPRRKRRAVEKKRFWLASTWPERWGKENFYPFIDGGSEIVLTIISFRRNVPFIVETFNSCFFIEPKMVRWKSHDLVILCKKMEGLVHTGGRTDHFSI